MELKHFGSFSYYACGVEIKIDYKRLEQHYAAAQYWLDSQIMTDMVPLMPHRNGMFINLTRAQSASLAGSGRVVAAAAPTGRFLYMGKVMIDPETGSPWARPGAKKIVTERPLTYSNPAAVPMWFEEAKRLHAREWENGVKRKIGGE